MNTTQENSKPPTDNHVIISEIQTLKEKMEEYSKQLNQSVQKLLQLKPNNLILREENSALSIAGKKQRRFQTQFQHMQPLGTPAERDNTILWATPLE